MDRAAGDQVGAGDQVRAKDALQDELRVVDEELAGLRAEVAQLRGQFGGRDSGPMDLAENAAAITAAEEQEALIGVLEQRRAGLLRKLGLES
ncbi:MAG TPA: hypothetical protein VH561_06215 [Micromonosporaceae bacterium]